MIRIVKPDAPAILEDRGKRAAEILCRAFEESRDDYLAGRKKFDFDAKIYAAPTVKRTLLRAQHDKCAFCESKFTHVGFGDVEHFRPKAAHRQHPRAPLVRPGYYWLAYAWSNLFASCQLCNQRHKKNLFPLEDPSRRARSHDRPVEDEAPLLIDCGAEDPEAFIGFRGEVAFPIGENARGRETISTLGINRKALVEERRRYLDKIHLLTRLIRELERSVGTSRGTRDPGIEADRADLRRYRARLRKLTRDEAPYASMVRSMLGRGR